MKPIVFCLVFLTSVRQATSSRFDFSSISGFNLGNADQTFTTSHLSSIGSRSIGTPFTAAVIESSQAVSLSSTEAEREDSGPNETETSERQLAPTVSHAHESIGQIIEREVSNSGFKSYERRAQLRKTLNLIATNNHKLFMDDERNFKRVFNKTSYAYFKKGKYCHFLHRFCLLIGADQLLKCFRGLNIVLNDSYIPVFKYLLETKQLDDILKLLVIDRRVSFAEETKEYVQSALLARCPENLSLKRALIKTIGHSGIIFNLEFLINGPETQETFEKFAKAAHHLEMSSYSPSNIRTIVKDNMDYYVNAGKNIKFIIIKTMLAKDDLEELIHLLTIDPSMVIYFEESTHVIFFKTEYSNIMIEAVKLGASNCLDFLLQCFPELAFSTNGYFDPPVLYLAKRRPSDLGFETFEKYGFGAEFIVTIDGKDFNLLQASFHRKFMQAFIYYSGKVGGNKTAKQMIRAIWKSDEAILESIFETFDAGFINHIIKLFGIDVNSTFKYKNYEGNAIIFTSQIESNCRIHHDPRLIGINLSIPTFVTDPTTGKKESIVLWRVNSHF